MNKLIENLVYFGDALIQLPLLLFNMTRGWQTVGLLDGSVSLIRYSMEVFPAERPVDAPLLAFGEI